MQCNLCSNHIEDIALGGFLMPFGEVCSECLTAIYGNDYQEKKEMV